MIVAVTHAAEATTHIRFNREASKSFNTIVFIEVASLSLFAIKVITARYFACLFAEEPDAAKSAESVHVCQSSQICKDHVVWHARPAGVAKKFNSNIGPIALCELSLKCDLARIINTVQSRHRASFALVRHVLRQFRIAKFD